MRIPHLLLRVLALLTVLLAVLAPSARAAESLDPKNVPDPLKPWTAWALHGSEGALCPAVLGQKDVVRCAWPSRLELSVDEHGGRFTHEGGTSTPRCGCRSRATTSAGPWTSRSTEGAPSS